MDAKVCKARGTCPCHCFHNGTRDLRLNRNQPEPQPTREMTMQDYIEDLLDIVDELDDDSTEDYSDL